MDSQTMIAVISQSIDDLEGLALTHLRNMAESWVSAAQAIIIIKANRLWHGRGYDTWGEYCHATFGIRASRVRQFEQALPLALSLLSNGITPHSDSSVRAAITVAVEHDLEAVDVYHAAQAAASIKGRNPTKAHFEAAASVLHEVTLSKAVSIDELTVSPPTAPAVALAIAEQVDERIKAKTLGGVRGELTANHDGTYTFRPHSSDDKLADGFATLFAKRRD